MSSVIKSLHAREILDSRGYPTVEVDITLENNIQARAMTPSGASTGSKEALERRDGDSHRYMGKGVQQVITTINTEIATALKGVSVESQEDIDGILITLDGTPNKTRCGANALLPVSMAVAKARAASHGLPLYRSLSLGGMSLPTPMMNIINGGAHADNSVDIQEFMIVPWGASSFAHAMQMGVEVYYALKSLLKKAGLGTGVGDEGGFAPNLSSNQAAMDIIVKAIETAGFVPGKDISLALDLAANEFYKDGQYHLESEGKSFSKQAFVDVLSGWLNNYPIISYEDAMEEGDWEGWAMLSQALGKKVQLVGDDLFVTQTSLLSKGIQEHIANAILIKPNQVGTLSQTQAAIVMAKKAGYRCVMSHRSGETEDTIIADLAVAFGTGQIKTGAPCRSERVAKYNQLLRLEEDKSLSYAGKAPYEAPL